MGLLTILDYISITNLLLFAAVIILVYYTAKYASIRIRNERHEYIILCKQIENILINIDKLKKYEDKSSKTREINKKIDYIFERVEKAKESIHNGNLEDARHIIEESNRVLEGAESINNKTITSHN